MNHITNFGPDWALGQSDAGMALRAIVAQSPRLGAQIACSLARELLPLVPGDEQRPLRAIEAAESLLGGGETPYGGMLAANAAAAIAYGFCRRAKDRRRTALLAAGQAAYAAAAASALAYEVVSGELAADEVGRKIYADQAARSAENLIDRIVAARAATAVRRYDDADCSGSAALAFRRAEHRRLCGVIAEAL